MHFRNPRGIRTGELTDQSSVERHPYHWTTRPTKIRAPFRRNRESTGRGTLHLCGGPPEFLLVLWQILGLIRTPKLSFRVRIPLNLSDFGPKCNFRARIQSIFVIGSELEFSVPNPIVLDLFSGKSGPSSGPNSPEFD